MERVLTDSSLCFNGESVDRFALQAGSQVLQGGYRVLYF